MQLHINTIKHKTGDMMKTKCFGMTALTLALLSASPAVAAAYPDRPINLVVGYSAGGATDILARLIAKGLSSQLGQTVIVENKPGANSNIGTEYVARAKNDGYTLLVGSIANTINRSLYKNLNYDYLKDFKSVGFIASIGNVLVVNPKKNINSVDEYISYAKKNPGKLTCASSGIGSSIHMSCELFKILTGTNILHIPYKGSGPAVNDLLGAQVDSMFDNIPSSVGRIKSNKLVPLAVTTEKRDPALPDVPTFREQGIDNFLVSSWFAIAAPKGTDDKVISKLNDALNKVIASPEVKDSFAKNGYTAAPVENTPAYLDQFTRDEIAKWEKVVRQANLQAN